MKSNKLVLFDIFSYSCMNCLRSLEFIKKIDKKYRKFGLETIVIHPPEWEFEKSRGNIISAIKKCKINFPVIIDKNKKMIKRLKINFWPSQVLLKDKKILYTHIGEGNYKKLEEGIINLLTKSETSAKSFIRMKLFDKRIFKREPKYTKFPAIYCGKRKKGKMPNLEKGEWLQTDENIKSLKNKSSLTILTKGSAINFVAESLTKKPIHATIKLNDKFYRNIIINKPQLYNIINLKNPKQKKLTLTTSPNLAVYSFSFQ